MHCQNLSDDPRIKTYDFMGTLLHHILLRNLAKVVLEAPWPSGRDSDSGMRSRVGSSLRSACCILEQDTSISQNVLVIPRKLWFRPEMTEKLFTGK